MRRTTSSRSRSAARLARLRICGRKKYAGKWGARVKDKLERFLQRRFCDGAIRLSTARRAFRDWKFAFKRFGL